MHFDAFFDSCTTKNPIQSKKDDNFDIFFDNCVLGKSKEPPRKRNKPVHTRLSYREDQNTKSSASSIEHELSNCWLHKQVRKIKPVVPRNLMCPGGFGNFNERQMHFIVWLLKCAGSVAKKMPIGEFEGTETQLQKFDNSTNLEQ